MSDLIPSDLIPNVSGVILGFILTWIPNFYATKVKVKSYKNSLRAEISKCKELAEEYLAEGTPKSPAWRLPTYAWENAFPSLLTLGTLSEIQTTLLNNIYLEIKALNLGLDNINQSRFVPSMGNIYKEECDRNILKAQHISDQYAETLKAINSIK